MPCTVGDVQGDFGEVARIENAIGGEQRLTFRQLGIVAAVEHEVWACAAWMTLSRMASSSGLLLFVKRYLASR